ncbi:hypothetical protein SEA_WOFFORD_154 [Streptomyces phage Wofford]|uniref:Uncharacterized protein n=1 Tax=Streptomyces phage Wofford TaxID=2283267 RepID=A0A345M9Z3_9CAUD|nr:hypothetical protein HWB78_gp141 [Streptomyces phage Wollford]AXH67314.1 hypothetical protein SEA_WOFFORD_154 [Streptomyces phage Wollford]
MNEIEAWLLNIEGVPTWKGLYREEAVVANNEVWVWFKIDGGQWALQRPQWIVIPD